MTLAIFIVGVVVFAITVYGTVMAGGLALTRREVKENEAVWGPTAQDPTELLP